MMSSGDRNRARLSSFPVALHDDPTMMARRDENACGFLVVNHHPVGAKINPVAVTLAHDRHRTGADIAPAVIVVPQRSGKLEQVYSLSFIDVLKDRAILDRHRWKLIELIAPAAHFVLHAADQVQPFEV